MNQSLYPAIAAVMPAAYATGLFRSSASFTEPPQTQGPTGNPSGAYTPIAGLQDIPCMDAPENFGGGIKAGEAKALSQIQSQGYRHVLLWKAYPELPAGPESGWQVTIDGLLYDLTGAETDSQRTQTRLRLQRIEI